jgi:type II secretory pathway component PulF
MKFKYWARSKDGKLQNGIIEASSKAAALEVLKSNELFVTGIEEAESAPFWAKEIKLFEKITAADIVMFSRQLSVMFTSGVPLAESLTAIANQSNKKKFKEKIIDLAQEVEGGTTFSKALARSPGVFSEFYVAVVRSGEVSGTLGDSLVYLADHLERDYKFQAQIKGAMVYPALVSVVMIGVFILTTVFIIPQLISVLEGAETELPAITVAVIALSNFIRFNWWILLIVLILLFGGLFFYAKTEEGKRNVDKALLKIPGLSDFLKKVYLTRFSENFSTLIAGGLPIGQALEVSGGIMGNVIYEEAVLEIKEKVTKGESITNVFSDFPEIFTPLFCQMSSVGEKTGHLDKTLNTVADFYRDEITRVTENMSSIIEPIMIVVLGGGVGLLMGAVLLPIYQISTSGL